MIQVFVIKRIYVGAILLLKPSFFLFLRRIIPSVLICSVKRAATPPPTHTHTLYATHHNTCKTNLLLILAPLPFSLFGSQHAQLLTAVLLSFLMNNPSLNCTSLLLASATPPPPPIVYTKKSPPRTSYH